MNRYTRCMQDVFAMFYGGVGKVRVMLASRDTTHIRWCLDQCIGGDLSGDVPEHLQRLLLAKGELLEIEKQRDILVVSQLIGHWAVPHTDGTLKELREAAAGNMSSDFVLRLIKGRGGKQLCDEQYHNCSFYSCVVIFK